MVEGVIMASATMSSVPLQGTKAVPSTTAISKVLLTDPVRRLFNQPNIVIHAIPRNNSPTAFKMVSPTSYPHNKSDINGEYQLPDKPGVSIQVINPSSNENAEEENLLPSKNNGKSEILLVPIVRKRKACGHFEPCESLVCNVIIQQHEDDEGIASLISININEDEIDASVTKHCENEKCDALSIDHDRCRRALIRLYPCDIYMMCDRCGITFKTWKARINHKKCRRKEVYQHNNANPKDVLKYWMRIRELQICEETKLKRFDHLDSKYGDIWPIEALKRNKELIIIPKLPPKNSMLNFLHANNNNSNINNNNNSIKAILRNKRKQAEKTDKELTDEMISNIILSCQNSIDSQKQNEKLGAPPLKQIKLADHLNGATIDIKDMPNLPNQQCIKLTEMSATNINSISIKNQQQKPQIVNTGLRINNLNATEQQPVANVQDTEPDKAIGVESLKQLNVNNWVMSSQPFTTPYKVVPIAELKSEPSLLHHTQGLPKFCVVPDTESLLNNTAGLVPKQMTNSVSKLAPKLLPKIALKATLEEAVVLNSGKFRPLQPALAGNVRNVEHKLLDTLLNKTQKLKRRRRKKCSKKGRFSCSVCSKKFSSLKYCELHKKRHNNDPSFFCKICDKGFLSKIIMSKHIVADHKPGQVRCEMCNEVLPSPQELFKHMKSPETKVNCQCSDCSESFDTCISLDFHMRKEHGFVICGSCKRQIAKNKFKRHLMLEHSISKNRLEIAFQKLSCPPGENDQVCEVSLISESTAVLKTVAKAEPVNENKVEMDCIAKNRSARRRNSKDFFICTVCERRFENEKQYQIHLANNPKKFTPCPDCSRKFHKKADYTEHSKTCPWNTSKPVNATPKRRKLSSANEDINLKSDNDNKSRNCIDQKQNENLDSINCKKAKLNEEEIVQIVQDRSNLKTAVEDKITNGLKTNSNDCLDKLKFINVDSNSQRNEDYDVIACDDKEDLLLSSKLLQTNSNVSAEFDKSIAVSNIHQDHNYQAVQ